MRMLVSINSQATLQRLRLRDAKPCTEDLVNMTPTAPAAQVHSYTQNFKTMEQHFMTLHTQS